jgi:hypothetical protein
MEFHGHPCNNSRANITQAAQPLFKSCAAANTTYARAESAFILEHYFASRSSAVASEAFCNAYRIKQQYTDW